MQGLLGVALCGGEVAQDQLRLTSLAQTTNKTWFGVPSGRLCDKMQA